MALYQVSVLNTYLKLQDKDLVEKAYKKYTKYFHNATIQENIKGSKEEEYQGIFLTELFDTILGYTLSPKPDFNLVAEYKNQNNSRKADGAILVNGNALAVIELKGTNTKDLESIRKQAFDYKANQKGCVYVITSNFEKLRFYINDATEFEEFNLFTLTLEEFALLYLCLSKDAILSNLPLKIKEESVTEEEQITKKFYADYSVFKRELYRDLVKQNAKRLKSTNVTSSDSQSELYRDADEQKQLEKNVKLALFKKSQKLIDRFLFIFFAEDRGLLPANSTIQILDDWQKLKDLDAIVPLYDRFKLYFKYLDEGRKGTSQKAEIYAYNGGLFKPDSILDNLLIDDVLLSKHARKLANYDFESQVDVNILGHIFENSLNEIESVNAEIEGGEFDKQKSKRKKDGVFYTPKYITKYIVENTVGKLCQEKKTELGFKEEEYYKSRTNRPKKKLQELVNVLDTYREWLLQLTICDPACGSGAFLNQALDFLIKEHRYIDELKANVLGGGLVFSDIENTILENNIYGVDLNEESVEIAKLSLWLRTAQPRRKLNDLNSNIKCGNSLIDSKTVAGDKAFNWQTEFPQIFNTNVTSSDSRSELYREGDKKHNTNIIASSEATKQSHQTKNGFDVIIGNPPYVKRQNLSNNIEISYLEKKFKSATYNFDLYLLFLEKASELINSEGLIAFINPSKFTSTKTGEGIRQYLFNNCKILKYIDFKEFQIFEDAITYCCIIIYTKGVKGITEYYLLNEFNPKEIESFSKSYIEIKTSSSGIGWQFNNTIEIKGKLSINDIANTFTGIETGADNIYIIKNDSHYVSDFINSKDKMLYPVLKGADLNRYNFESDNQFVILPYKTKRELFSLDEIKTYNSNIYNYLIQNKNELELRNKGGMIGDSWYGYVYPKNLYKYDSTRLIWSDISIRPQFSLDKNKNWHVRTVCSLELKADYKYINYEFLLTVFNSSLFEYYVLNNSNAIRGGYLRYRPQYVKEFMIPDLTNLNQKPFIEKADKMLSLNKDLQETNTKFQRTFQRKFEGLEKLPKKLESWYELTYAEFIKELAKKKIKLTLSEEAEWETYFNAEQQKAQALQNQITQTDKAIDQMVYELYGLTDEEIAIVENS